jgi:hypothetical protein
MSIHCRFYDPMADRGWDQFVESANEGTLFQRLDFSAINMTGMRARSITLFGKKDKRFSV